MSPTHFYTSSHHFRYKTLKYFTFKTEVRVTYYNFCSDNIRLQISKSKNVYLQKIGQGHGVKFSQLRHSMADVEIYKCLPHIFALAPTVSEI